MRTALRVGVASDIHLGHARNKAEFIIANLNHCFSNDAYFSTVDLVVLAGDVFDNGMPLSSEDVSHIDMWVAKLLRLCHKHKVMLRVLEGTPSHDRG